MGLIYLYVTLNKEASSTISTAVTTILVTLFPLTAVSNRTGTEGVEV